MPQNALRACALVAGLTVAAIAVSPSSASAGRKLSTDRTAPSIVLSTPSSGATVANPLTVTGSATDDRSVSRVTVAVDGATPSNASGTSTWTWAAPSLSAGSHTIAAAAYDAAGNVASTSITVSVSAPPAADTTAPAVVFAAPSAGSTVAGTFTATGSASDNTSLSTVKVKVDAGTWQLASGTASWSLGLDATSWAAGTHTLTAAATDTSGNVASTSVAVQVAAPSTTLTNGQISATDTVLNDPAATYGVTPVGRSRMASTSAFSIVLYAGEFTNLRGAYVRSTTTGASSYVHLPLDVNDGWSNASYTLSTAGELFVATGEGPIRVRRYALSGSPMPTSAVLLSSTLFGNSDSRTGDLVALAGGGAAYAWHQQGATGPEGMSVTRFTAAGGWSAPVSLTFMPTSASKQALAQHPSDGSLWLFNSPDSWGRVGAARLVESGNGLATDWTNAALLSPQVDGTNGPDPENPDLAAVADPTTGTVALAYQNANRRLFYGARTLAGSYVTVARFTASGQKSFLTLPVYVERISALGLSITGTATWLTFRPIDEATTTFDRLKVARYQGGVWSTPLDLGSPYDPYTRIGYVTDRPEVSVRLKDGSTHLFSLS